jgi:hypothetical protein
MHPDIDADEMFRCLQRWNFLYPARHLAPRFKLQGPDLNDLKWTVYDSQFSYGGSPIPFYARGDSAGEAVDSAIQFFEQSETKKL